MKFELKIDWKALAKTVTWRLTATTTTFFLTLIFTGSIEIGLSIAGVEIFLKMFLYYIHERLWKHVELINTTT